MAAANQTVIYALDTIGLLVEKRQKSTDTMLTFHSPARWANRNTLRFYQG